MVSRNIVSWKLDDRLADERRRGDMASVSPRHRRILGLLLMALPQALACSSSMGEAAAQRDGGAAACTASFASIRESIFLSSCTAASCHNSTDRAAGLDLQSSDAETKLLGAQAGTCAGATLVWPGSAAQSLLYRKIDGTAACGSRMPLGGAPLDDATLRCVAGWIDGLPPDAGSMSSAPDASPSDGAARSDAPPPCSLTLCGSACVDLASDANHCGDCAHACATGEVCRAGSCSSGGCGPLSQCGSSCVDLQNSATNCGACARTCGSAQSCVAGMCACPTGRTSCGSDCVDVTIDSNNCGSCGHACAPGQTCSSGQCRCGSSTVSFASAVQPILSASCALNGCHGGTAAKENLNLTTGRSYGNLVNVPATECSDGRKRVTPGDTSNSYLLQKLLDTALCGNGTQMPKSGQSIPASQVQTVADWICEGAPDN